MFGDDCLWNEQNIGISLNFTNSMHNKVRECILLIIAKTVECAQTMKQKH